MLAPLLSLITCYFHIMPLECVEIQILCHHPPHRHCDQILGIFSWVWWPVSIWASVETEHLCVNVETLSLLSQSRFRSNFPPPSVSASSQTAPHHPFRYFEQIFDTLCADVREGVCHLSGNYCFRLRAQISLRSSSPPIFSCWDFQSVLSVKHNITGP